MKKRAASLVIVVSGITWWLTLPPPPQSISSSTPARASTAQPTTTVSLPTEKQAEATVAIEDLPSLPDFSTLSEEEVHHAPEALIEAGEAIQRMIAAAEADRPKRKPTLTSLLECAANDGYPAALRALCYREGLSGIQRWDEAISVSDYSIPVAIQTLAQKATH